MVEKYYCTKCKSNHKYDSSIGSNHYKFMNFRSFKDWELTKVASKEYPHEKIQRKIKEIDLWLNFYKGENHKLIQDMLIKQERYIDKLTYLRTSNLP
mgnify:CR=1 FL=1